MSPPKPAEARQQPGALYAKTVSHDFVWKVRLTHPDRADLRVEWAGRPIVFDPVEPVAGDRVILTGAGPDRIRGTAAAVANGKRPDVTADRAILDWLGGLGPLGEGRLPEGEVDGVMVRSLAYTAGAVARPLNHFLKASIGVFRPSRVIGPLRAARESAEREPVAGVSPRIWELTLPGAGRLVHLDLALHRETSPSWLLSSADYSGADWVITGCAFGESEAVATHLPHFAGKQILVTDLVNGERRARSLPVEGITPLRDRLHGLGMPAHVFATQASYRFE
ncbi:MAG: hypothetical protein EXR69_07780 [Myxococcales bacterium]|nr:hypothetical protein [Myxococcales bacterium]